MFKIGLGYDTHRLVRGRPLILGGIEIPYAKGLAGHSDADVLLHAVCDALLGAAGKGDIGLLFPDTEPKWKDVASHLLVTDVMAQLSKENYRVINIDATVICQAPKLAPYKEKMCQCISMLTQAEQVNIKATTTEGLNDEGRSLGISAQAIVLITKTT